MVRAKARCYVLPRWTRFVTPTLQKLRSLSGKWVDETISPPVSRNGYATVAPTTDNSPQKEFPSKSPVNLDKNVFGQSHLPWLFPKIPLLELMNLTMKGSIH